MTLLAEEISVSELFKTYSHDILCYSASILKNKDDAKDALQEVFIRFINNRHSFKGECSYKTWLLIITRNYCYTKLKQRPINIERLEDNILSHVQDNIDVNISLQDAIAKLSGEENELLYLKEYAGYTYKEISEILEINVNTAKTKLFKIRQQLKEYLK